MKKIREYHDCVVAQSCTGLLVPIEIPDELRTHLSAAALDDDLAKTEVDRIPGVYRVTIEVWFSQGYSDGYPAAGESDYELRLTNMNSIYSAKAL